MSPLAKEIVAYTIMISVNLDQAKTGRDELRLNSVLQLLTQAQILAQADQDELARRLFVMARNLGKLKQKAEEK